MAISLFGTTGSLFNAIGKCGLLVKQIQSYQSTQKSNMLTGLYPQLAAQPDIQAIVGSQYLGQLNGPEGAGSLAANIASLYLDRLVFNDTPQPGQTLTSPTTILSIAEVIRQMQTQGATILQTAVTATPVAVTNPGPSFMGTGTGVLVASTVRPFDGKMLENAFQEKQQVLCVNDGYTGTASPGNEQFHLTGQSVEPNVFAYDWPAGSGASVFFNAVDGNRSNASGNLLTNSNWATFTGGLPANWAVAVGGSLLTQETGVLYDGMAALKITGDGATLLSMKQAFGSAASGTAASLSNQVQYSVCFWLRGNATPPAAGKLQIALVDGGGAAVQDQAGTPNTLTVDLTKLTTSYTAYTAAFRTPEIMPSSLALQISMPTGAALSNGSLIWLAKLGMGQMVQSALHCPFAIVHAGSVPFEQGDIGYVQVNNSRGSGGTLSTFQTVLFQLLSSYYGGNEIIFPSSLTPNISDGLIG